MFLILYKNTKNETAEIYLTLCNKGYKYYRLHMYQDNRRWVSRVTVILKQKISKMENCWD
jgi:hypothetical protein